MNATQNLTTSAGKPIVKLVDVVKTYEMGHSVGRRRLTQPPQPR